MPTPESSSIALIDFQSISSLDVDSLDVQTVKCVAKELVDAFASNGFAFIINHGVSDQTAKWSKFRVTARFHMLDHIPAYKSMCITCIADAFDSAKSFFSLPQTKKNLVAKKGVGSQGYNPIDSERIDKKKSATELRESFDVWSCDGVYPDDVVPIFKPSVVALTREMLKLTKLLLKTIAIGLDLDCPHALTKCHSGTLEHLKGSGLTLMHYPPVPVDAEVNSIRCGEHTDYGTITILLQDNMGGLQVRGRGGQWIAATPIPGTLVINVGDMLQRWSNDRLMANVHKVIVPEEEVRRRCSRHSIGFFVHPDDEVAVSPLGASPPKYQPLNAGEYFQNVCGNAYTRETE